MRHGHISLPLLLRTAAVLAILSAAAAPARAGDWEVCAADNAEQAVAACSRLLRTKLTPNRRFVVYARRCIAYRKTGDLEDAARDCDRAVGLMPDKAIGYQIRAFLHEKRAAFEQAIADYKQAMRLSTEAKDRRQYKRWISQTYHLWWSKLKDHREGIAVLDAALRFDPNDAEAFYRRGQSHGSLRKYDSAIADFDRAIGLDAAMGKAFRQRGVAKFGRAFHGLGKGALKDQYETARSDFTEAIRLNPKDALAYHFRGLAGLETNDMAGAVADFTEALRIDPKGRTESYFERGRAHFSALDWASAIADFTEALRHHPKHASAYALRAFARARSDDPDGAIADLDRSIEIDPKRAYNLASRGDLLFKKGETDLAIKDYDAALAIDGKHAAALVGRGMAWLRKEELGRALLDFDAALQGGPRSALALAGRGEVWLKRKEPGRAIGDLDAAIAADAFLTAAFTLRGLAYEAKGDRERARADFHAALAVPAKGDKGPWAHATATQRLAALDAAGSAPSPTTTSGTPQRRVALVIGNAAYKHAPALLGAKADAEAIAAALTGLGFQTVRLELDLTRDRLVDALRGFARVAETADWAVVYFAGHGLEIGGANYLVPVDAKLEVDRDVQFEAVPLDQVVLATGGARRLRLILLDACRDNPFLRHMRRSVAMRAVGRGLAAVEPDAGTLVVYAAKHGELAVEGVEAQTSPFVAAFLKNVAATGVDIRRLLDLVRDDVLAATGGRQQPFRYGSLPGAEEFVFAGR